MTARRVDRGWVRDEPGELSGGGAAYLHLADRHDVSPAHVGYPSGYDSRCGWCYLGAPHTVAAHDVKVLAELDRVSLRQELDSLYGRPGWRNRPEIVARLRDLGEVV